MVKRLTVAHTEHGRPVLALKDKRKKTTKPGKLLLRRGVIVDGRFFIASVFYDASELIISCEEGTGKRTLELRIKKTLDTEAETVANKKKTQKEIEKILSNLSVQTFMDEEILVIKQEN